jgi:hypothetical protein
MAGQVQEGDKTEKDQAQAVWKSYGERYENLFHQFQYSGGEGSKDAAFEMGRRALTYYIRAQTIEALSGFVSKLINSTNNPYQLKSVIAELEAIVEQDRPVGCAGMCAPIWLMR